MFKRTFAILILLFGLLVALPGQAAQGLYLGTGLGYSFPNSSFSEEKSINMKVEQEGGFSWEFLHAGYNFTDQMGVNLLWGQAGGGGTLSALNTSEDVTWSTNYLDVNFRYTFPMEGLSPYLEAGLGGYSMISKSDLVEVDLDPVLGYRLGVGGIIPISKFYIAPEFSYHMAPFDEGVVQVKGLGSADVSGAGAGNFSLLTIKIGYMFGK